ncbi:MAG: helix-turn-helix domain-containing protein [Erysipelotrichales bacterium]|nr:helix-turn-helix domain-containing protein [Erysipelotrichales bacterium]
MNNSYGKFYFDLLKNKMNKSAYILFTILISNSQQKGFAYGSNKYYANILNCSTRTISNLLKILVDKKYIRIEKPKSFKRKIYIEENILTK